MLVVLDEVLGSQLQAVGAVPFAYRLYPIGKRNPLNDYDL